MNTRKLIITIVWDGDSQTKIIDIRLILSNNKYSSDMIGFGRAINGKIAEKSTDEFLPSPFCSALISLRPLTLSDISDTPL